MLSNLKTLRPIGLVLALIIPFSIFCYLYTDWIPETSISPKITLSQSSETTATGTNPNPASVAPQPSSDNESHYNDALIYQHPDKVWHSAKFDNLTETQRERIRSWTKTNPFCRQELLTDRSAQTFVRAHYNETRPDIVEVYESISIPILRADLLRYLILLAEGGIWGDLDVTCEKGVTEWVPLEYQNQTIDMIVGLEFDFEWRGSGKAVASQFCNWVFVARKSSRNLQVVVDTVIAKLKEIALANSVHIEGLTLEMLSDVVDVTGPKIMTVAILKSLGQLLDRPVDDRDFSGIKQPKLVGDVLIMPGNAFAALQNGNPTDQGDVLVTHHYEGSWKKEDQEAKERKKQKEQSTAKPPPATTEK
jgi:mannosyltransferase OCH1-like enzyme